MESEAAVSAGGFDKLFKCSKIVLLCYNKIEMSVSQQVQEKREEAAATENLTDGAQMEIDDIMSLDQKMLGRLSLGAQAKKFVFYPDDVFKRYWDFAASM